MSQIYVEAEHHVAGGFQGLAERMRQWGYLGEPQINDALVQEAVAKYQSQYRDVLSEGTRALYGRDVDADGSIGLVTSRLINERTCGTPDFADHEEARWPDSCVKEITYSFRIPSGLPGLNVDETMLSFRAALQMWIDLFELDLPIRQEEYPNTRIHASLKSLPGSTLAWSMLSQGTCSQRAEQAYDSTIKWSRKLADPTIAHEVGHALGLQHTPSDPQSLMFPSMRGQPKPNATDIAQMVRLGYKRRTTPPPPPPGPPGPPGPPPKGKVRATVWIGEKQYELVGKGQNGGGVWW